MATQFFDEDSIKKLLLQILEIIHYSQDREKFCQNFIRLITNEIVLRGLESMDEQAQEKIQSEVQGKSLEETLKILGFYADQHITQEIIEQSVEKMFEKYMEAIKLTLTQKQKDEIASLIGKKS